MQPRQIDELLHPGSCRTVGNVSGNVGFLFFKVSAGTHRVDEIQHGVDLFEGALQFVWILQIGLGCFDVVEPGAVPKMADVASQCPNGKAGG